MTNRRNNCISRKRWDEAGKAHIGCTCGWESGPCESMRKATRLWLGHSRGWNKAEAATEDLLEALTEGSITVEEFREREEQIRQKWGRGIGISRRSRG